MVDAGVLADSETEAYNYDASEDKATWEGEIGKKSYKAEYSGKQVKATFSQMITELTGNSSPGFGESRKKKNVEENKKVRGIFPDRIAGCPCDPFYSYGSSGPGHCRYIKSARRAAAYTESQIAADAVQLYLYDEKEAGA